MVESIPVAGVSVQTVFTSDVFNQGKALDTVFVAQFLPQSHANWPGNLKKLKLHKSRSGDSDSGEGQFDQVVDVHGEPAYETLGEQKGQLRRNALTFWTDVATLSRGNGETVPDVADGAVVTRGGAGQKIDGFVRYSIGQGEFAQHFIGDTNADTPVDGYGPRQLFYEPQSGHELQPFDANATTLSELGSLLDPDEAMTEAQNLNLIRWARGQDVDNGSSTARGWLLGELIHSTPLALNYGATRGYSEENPNVRVLFGSGDGAFHIVENTDAGGRDSGREVFGFFPRETLATIPWRRQGTGTGAGSGLARRYGVDGAPVVLRVDRHADGTLDSAVGDEAYAYFGLRRGGYSYFALDISNPDGVPTLKWKITRTAGGDFDELGLTFSTPVVGKVNYSGAPVDVLIFAGGYDGGWNEDYSERRGKDLGAEDDTVGNAIFIVNARTGELVWKAARGETGVSSDIRYQHAGLVDSIPSTVAALQTPAGIIHRLYVGDSGGAVWRVDLPPNMSGQAMHRRDRWFITKLADLGADAAEPGGSVSDDRRFFHAPDIVQSYDAAGDFDGVLIQSGNREDPNETLVENALFYLKDREVISGSGVVRAENDIERPPARYQIGDLPDRTHCMDDSGQETGETGDDCIDGSTERGWQFRFPQRGEKGLSTPLTDGGRVFASTFTPPLLSPCVPRRGQGRLYVLRLRDAAAVANHVKHYELGDGIPAAATSVGEMIFLPGGGINLHDLDGDGLRDTRQFLPSEARKLYRTYWREPGADHL
jgi:type IV pilus assembly protein PilY1